MLQQYFRAMYQSNDHFDHQMDVPFTLINIIIRNDEAEAEDSGASPSVAFQLHRVGGFVTTHSTARPLTDRFILRRDALCGTTRGQTSSQ
jgi:hypothetical protein